MVVLLVIIWFLSGLLAVHIASVAKLDGPPQNSDVWLAAAGAFALIAVLLVCVGIAIEKGRQS